MEACQDRTTGNLGRSSLEEPSQDTPRSSSISKPPKGLNGEGKAFSTKSSIVSKEKATAVSVKVGAKGRKAQGASSLSGPAPSQTLSGKKYAAIDPPIFDGPAVKRRALLFSRGWTERQEKSTRKPAKIRKPSTRSHSHSTGKAKIKTRPDAATQPSSSPSTARTRSTSQSETIPCRSHHLTRSNGAAEPRDASYRTGFHPAAAAQAQILTGNRGQHRSPREISSAPYPNQKRKLGEFDGAGVIDLTLSPDHKQTKREELVLKNTPGCTAGSNRDMSCGEWKLEESSKLQSMERRLANLEKLLDLQRGVMDAYGK